MEEAANPNNIAGSVFYTHVPQKGTQNANRVLLGGGKISDRIKVYYCCCYPLCVASMHVVVREQLSGIRHLLLTMGSSSVVPSTFTRGFI